MKPFNLHPAWTPRGGVPRARPWSNWVRPRDTIASYARPKRGVPEGGLFDFSSAREAEDLGAESFSSSSAAESKSARKRQAKEYFRCAEKLTSLGKGQLRQAAEHLDDEVLELVRLAQRLPYKNQGRKRLEQTIAKRLRETKADVDVILGDIR